MTKTKITVNLPYAKPIAFIVTNYYLQEGMIFFLDKHEKKRGFPTAWCEIEEVA